MRLCGVGCGFIRRGRGGNAAGTGAYLVKGIAGCGNYHTARGGPMKRIELAGGNSFGGPKAPFKSYAPNITPDLGTAIGAWANAQLVTAIREGKRPDGSAIGNTHKRTIHLTGNNMWHSDSSFRPVPTYVSINCVYEVPDEGGETEFVSTRAAFGRLSDDEKRTIEPLRAVHDYVFSRSKVGKDAVTPSHAASLPPGPPPLNWSTSYDKETEDQRWQSSVTRRKKSSPSYAR